MQFSEQGTIDTHRYTIVPCTLVFLIQRDHVLLLRGAATKHLWANRLNGIGGHVEASEDIRESALREFHEETGLELVDARLAALIHIQGQGQAPGVVLNVFVGNQATGKITPSDEGDLEWHLLTNLPTDDLVENLAELLPRIANSKDEIVYGLYTSDETGLMHFSLR